MSRGGRVYPHHILPQASACAWVICRHRTFFGSPVIFGNLMGALNTWLHLTQANPLAAQGCPVKKKFVRSHRDAPLLEVRC